MLRNSILINSHEFLLAQNSDVNSVKERIREAVRAGGDFVDLTVVGNRQVSTFVTAGVSITLESAEVNYDSRDTGDLEDPYGTAEFYPTAIS